MNFIKNWIGSLAGAAMLFGLLFAGYGIWSIFDQRNVKSTPTTLEIAQLDHSGEIVYATVNGGSPDLANTYSYEIKRRKRSSGALTTSYYVPVLDGNQVAYIMETRVDPASINFSGTLSNTGLLQASSKLPQTLQDTYGELLEDQPYSLLNTAYTPKGMASKLGMIALGLGVAIAGFFIRKALFRRPGLQQA